MEPADHELLLAWRDGDRRAGSTLFDRHFAAVQRFFINKACTQAEVEELIQRTFTAGVESVGRFRGDAAFKTWLLGIARNVLRDWIREAMREGVDAAEVDEFCSDQRGAGVSSGLDAKREQQLLLAALRRIPIESQVLLELFYWEELTAAELAEVLGVPEGTARTRLRKAKLALRGTIDEIARTKEELESTRSGLEGWARGLREKLAV